MQIYVHYEQILRDSFYVGAIEVDYKDIKGFTDNEYPETNKEVLLFDTLKYTTHLNAKVGIYNGKNFIYDNKIVDPIAWCYLESF